MPMDKVDAFVDQVIQDNREKHADFLLKTRQMYQEKHKFFPDYEAKQESLEVNKRLYFSIAFLRATFPKNPAIVVRESAEEEPENQGCCFCCFFSDKQKQQEQEPLIVDNKKEEKTGEELGMESFCQRHCHQNGPDLSNRIKEMLQQKQAAGIKDAEFEQKFLEKTAYLEPAAAPAPR
jgi:hypothetical protein